jgi:hypothetical protein
MQNAVKIVDKRRKNLKNLVMELQISKNSEKCIPKRWGQIKSNHL